MNDLGVKSEPMPVSPEKKSEEKSYPRIYLNGDQVEAFTSGSRLQFDAEYELPVRVKVCGISKNEHSDSLELNIVASGPLKLVKRPSSKPGKDPMDYVTGEPGESKDEGEMEEED
jgi:hypothetical protein